MRFGFRHRSSVVPVLITVGCGLSVGSLLVLSLSCTPPPSSGAAAPSSDRSEEGLWGDGTPPPVLAGPSTGATGRALLVGVTEYDHLPKHARLSGPANDVVLFRDLLISRFGFNADNIVVLSETAGKAESRPTKANIEREFAALARAAREGDQVVVLMAGHGDQQPEANPLDPDSHEPDGLDEIFLPADVKRWAGGTERVPQAITDNEMRLWLTAITDKKAYVWATFDCCHSGNLTRGSEVSRQLAAGFLVPTQALEDARRVAAARLVQSKRNRSLPSLHLDPMNEFLVALFACRSTETTPELLTPTPRGLLTSTVCEVLNQARRPITYRELVQRVQVRYATRPQGAPTPAVEGRGQEREILGTRQWLARSAVILTLGGGGYAINVGRVHGVTAGTIYSVTGPAGSAKAGTLLGHVKVAEVRLSDSRVEPCEFDQSAAPTGLPGLCPCQPVFIDYGTRRFKVGVDLPPGAARTRAMAVLADLAEGKAGLIESVGNPDAAEMVVVRLPDGYALCDASRSRYHRALPEPSTLEFRSALSESLERVYRAKNLLAVAGKAHAEMESGGTRVRLETEVLVHDTEGAPGVPARATRGTLTLKEGQYASYRLKNTSPFAIDVSLLIVGTDLAIIPFFPRAKLADKHTIPAGGTLVTPAGEVACPFGPEQLVVIGVRSRTTPVDFTCLAQAGLDERRGSDHSSALRTPGGQLLEAALYHVEGTRGLKVTEAEELGMLVLPWVTEPASQERDRPGLSD